jgi:hypothetical protein
MMTDKTAPMPTRKEVDDAKARDAKHRADGFDPVIWFWRYDEGRYELYTIKDGAKVALS